MCDASAATPVLMFFGSSMVFCNVRLLIALEWHSETGEPLRSKCERSERGGKKTKPFHNYPSVTSFSQNGKVNLDHFGNYIDNKFLALHKLRAKIK